jgi:hypothetical protein
MSVSPCMRCTRVAAPRECDNKDCKVWQEWFVGRWDQMRRQPRLAMEQVDTQPMGVNIGGTYYAQPHRVRGYLQKDPCVGCLCPRDLCVLPCKLKRQWVRTREDAFLS